jgi:hypothetical protein
MDNREKQYNTAAEVLKRVEFCIQELEAKPYAARLRIVDIYDKLSIFDWWPEYLSKSKLYEMRQFLKEAIKLGYEGYVCFKVGATGCANGMWAHTELETDEGYSPNNCPILFRSFTPAYRYWDVTDKDGNWDFEGKYKDEEDRRQNWDRLKTIKELEAFIETHKDKVYRK